MEGAAALSPIPQRQATTAGSEPPLPGAPPSTARPRDGPRHRREGHPYKIFFVHLRPSRMLCGICTHPAVAPTALLFLGLPPSGRAGSGAGEALAGTATRGGGREKGARSLASAALKAADIVRLYCVPPSPSLPSACTPRRRGRGSEARFVLSSSKREKAWNW